MQTTFDLREQWPRMYDEARRKRTNVLANLTTIAARYAAAIALGEDANVYAKYDDTMPFPRQRCAVIASAGSGLAYRVSTLTLWTPLWYLFVHVDMMAMKATVQGYLHREQVRAQPTGDDKLNHIVLVDKLTPYDGLPFRIG